MVDRPSRHDQHYFACKRSDPVGNAGVAVAQTESGSDFATKHGNVESLAETDEERHQKPVSKETAVFE
jgi:hypothetical protein